MCGACGAHVWEWSGKEAGIELLPRQNAAADRLIRPALPSVHSPPNYTFPPPLPRAATATLTAAAYFANTQSTTALTAPPRPRSPLPSPSPTHTPTPFTPPEPPIPKLQLPSPLHLAHAPPFPSPSPPPIHLPHSPHPSHQLLNVPHHARHPTPPPTHSTTIGSIGPTRLQHFDHDGRRWHELATLRPRPLPRTIATATTGTPQSVAAHTSANGMPTVSAATLSTATTLPPSELQPH